MVGQMWQGGDRWDGRREVERGACPGGGFLVGGKALVADKGGGATVVWVAVVVLVHDRMDHHCLVVDGENGVGWDVDPVLCTLY